MGVEYEGALFRILSTPAPVGLRVEGEIDANSVESFLSALRAATRLVSGDVVLDLGALTFVDLGGLRAIVEIAGELRQEGRDLVLSPVAPHVRQLIQIIGWDTAPGVRLANDGAP
ncbi:STAS domain-containing protein [Spongiactinospora sp. TRM90649]|uniref:STAS domain-containing protein n=1 Tax=Spongiactinospora sp. TRM90649 TaxID=3031114 RepID=UPI0023F9ADD9|nr:STAS domain-containing protein [Spongiactinospora sp. TRM90649]MDF5755868.1 STAS domain-containing protein [Spongiactinospora sp. TRM90649]